MTSADPIFLLYLLTVGREKELVLRLHGDAVTAEMLSAWMNEGAVRGLTVSRFGDEETSTLLINFRYVIGARLAPYTQSRTSSF